MDDTQTSNVEDEDFSPGCSSVHQKRSEPEPSFVSMRSDKSMGLPVNFKSGDTKTVCSSVNQKSSEPEPSCVSMRSDKSMDYIKSGDTQTDLRLRDCGVTEEVCAALTSALRSNPKYLRVLDLSWNKIGNSVKLLSPLLADPCCKLEILRLIGCGMTDEGCAALASALRSNPEHLRDMDLSKNKLGSSVTLLSALLEDPRCKLEILWLIDCYIPEEGCAALISALRKNPKHLRKLNLSGSKVGESGRKFLSDLKDDPHYKLETLHY